MTRLRRSKIVKQFRIAITRALCPITRMAARSMPLDDFFYGVYISDKYRYVYIDNPKTGCTSLKSALLELELRGTSTVFELSNYRFIHGWGSPLKQRPSIWPNPTLTDLVAQGFKFLSFVRNPYTRLVSCYLSKFTGNASLSLFSTP